jgi:hypothetical protein
MLILHLCACLNSSLPLCIAIHQLISLICSSGILLRTEFLNAANSLPVYLMIQMELQALDPKQWRGKMEDTIAAWVDEKMTDLIKGPDSKSSVTTLFC